MDIRIENDALAVTVAPHYGARVTSLLDKAGGRDWIAPGGESPETGETAAYLADEAVGWDECFPTVSPWDGSETAWGRPLRDHGDLWGRPWAVDAQSRTGVTTSYATGEFRFIRSLELQDRTLVAGYSVSNEGTAALPYMWALHGLLAVAPGEHIALRGVSRLEATYLFHRGRTLAAPSLVWPGPDPALGLALDNVQPVSEHFAGKFYTGDFAAPVASVGTADERLEIGWDASEVPYLGLWLNYGGWPTAGDVHHIAFEPTTAPVDHLGEALARGLARTLEPGATHRWTVTLTCHSLPSS